MRNRVITPVAILLVVIHAAVGFAAQSNELSTGGSERPGPIAALPNTPPPELRVDMDRALAALARRDATRSTGRLHTEHRWSAMSMQAPRAQGGFPSRRKWILLATAIGAGTGAVAGAVAPASACMSTTSVNGGPFECNDRGATIGAFALGGALGGLLIGLLSN